MKLSIIIPVYNVEPYVGKTLASIFDTTASMADFEVIVVNDGTKDGSMNVVRQFADRPNLIILEQENQGLSVARMKGLSVASGEYVWFVDSDDYLMEDGVVKVLRLLEERPGAEVLRFPLMCIYDDGSRDGHMDHPVEKEVVADGRTIVRDMGLEVVTCQRYVIRRFLFSDPRLFFPEGLLFEDVYFGAVLVTIAKEIDVLPDPVYIYRYRTGSIMRSLDVRSSYDMVAVHKMVMQFKEGAVDPSDCPWFERYIFCHLKFAYTRIKHQYQSREFKRFVRSKGLYVWRSWNRALLDVSWKRIVRRLFFCEMPGMYMRLCGNSAS